MTNLRPSERFWLVLFLACVAVFVLAAIRAVKADDKLCAPVDSVYFAAKGNAEVSDVLLIRRSKIPAIERIIPEAIDPAMAPSSGLLIVWHDRKAVLFVVINETICGRGIDVLHDEVPRLQAILAQREFKLYPKQYRKPRRRLHTIRYATKKPEAQIERPAGKAME